MTVFRIKMYTVWEYAVMRFFQVYAVVLDYGKENNSVSVYTKRITLITC